MLWGCIWGGFAVGIVCRCCSGWWLRGCFWGFWCVLGGVLFGTFAGLVLGCLVCGVGCPSCCRWWRVRGVGGLGG